MAKSLASLVDDIWILLRFTEHREEGRRALLALIKAYGFNCGSSHELGKHCPGHLKERDQARKELT